MKKLFVLVFVTLISTSVFSTNENPNKKEIRAKIVTLLGSPNFVINNEVKTIVEFTLNNKGEIVILNVDCEKTQICDYIKSRLNYKKVYNAFIQSSNDVYKIPLTIRNK
ncbi:MULTISPECIES: hypothetical protein [unclassified Tenacibaculum]|uniref:hypothetical protein n=1 Tax=unclassified Tenacibaculum TaxID=2635139 RepID=UPI001F1FC073|nr:MULTISPECIES: hypothetical protein [unclassified Tenacibaculum]MCF2876038.1 hypothetical protein [Tenacibaculum sp. Cn5-1]MCF2936113.1 hypothetical protein [Tenacibaculum sp. Cn5-34]MCG7512674.1 hypothetical protein [Tenacibaculum sp. Cn5-46]